jgi:hypothetical protein
MTRYLLAAGLISLTALTVWGAEDYQTRYERFKKLHAERRQQFDDYCKALKLDTTACIMKMSKDGHCEGQGMPETQWVTETCQWNGTCCLPPARAEGLTR